MALRQSQDFSTAKLVTAGWLLAERAIPAVADIAGGGGVEGAVRAGESEAVKWFGAAQWFAWHVPVQGLPSLIVSSTSQSENSSLRSSRGGKQIENVLNGAIGVVKGGFDHCRQG